MLQLASKNICLLTKDFQPAYDGSVCLVGRIQRTFETTILTLKQAVQQQKNANSLGFEHSYSLKQWIRFKDIKQMAYNDNNGKTDRYSYYQSHKWFISEGKYMDFLIFFFNWSYNVLKQKEIVGKK